MTDIKWHFTDEDELLTTNRERKILILTDVTMRLSNSSYYNWHKGTMDDCAEKLIKFAFIEDYGINKCP